MAGEGVGLVGDRGRRGEDGEQRDEQASGHRAPVHVLTVAEKLVRSFPDTTG
jgi:hypothetical protein